MDDAQHTMKIMSCKETKECVIGENERFTEEGSMGVRLLDICTQQMTMNEIDHATPFTRSVRLQGVGEYVVVLAEAQSPVRLEAIQSVVG